MAITFITSPNDWQNAYNEIVFNVSSNNSTQPNFQFLVDVNVSGQTNPVARLTYPKQVGVGTINLDVANVIKDYVTYDFGSFNVSGVLSCNNSVAKFWLQFGEIYDNVSGVPVIYPNLAQYGTSGTPKNSSNAIFDFLDWSKTAFTSKQLLLAGTNVDQALNQTTFTDKIKQNQQRFLTFFTSNLSTQFIGVKTYNESNVELYSSFAELPITLGIRSINVGYSLLTALGVTNLDNVAYYIFYIGENFDAYKRRIEIDKTCSKYQTYRLHWLNNLGGFDSFNFTKVSKESVEIERKQFKKFQQLNYAKTDRLKTNYFTKFSENIELNSDLLTDAEWEGLRELILSPVVMLEVDRNTYYPVNILETNYPINKVVNETRPTSLVINIQYTFDNYRQSL